MAANMKDHTVSIIQADQNVAAASAVIDAMPCPGFVVLGGKDRKKKAERPRTRIGSRLLLNPSPRLSPPQLPQPRASYPLNELARALAVHPRTILRMATGLPNPYWVEGHDSDLDTAMLALIMGSSPESIASLIENEDAALDARQAARLLRCKCARFYRKQLRADWQVGRVKRYSLLRLARVRHNRFHPAAR